MPPDTLPLARADLASLPAAQWADLRLALHPSVHLVPVRFPVYALREDFEARGAAGVRAPDAKAPGVVLVWRRQEQVRFHPLPPQEAELLAGWIEARLMAGPPAR